MDKNRITVLLGAGAMMDCTSISTNSLTDLVSTKEQAYFDEATGKMKTYPLLTELRSDLIKYYLPDETVSFEDMLHTLEMMASYDSSQRKQTVKEYKSVFPMFTGLANKDEEKMRYVYTAKQDLVATIIDEIGRKEKDWTKTENKWFSDFFLELEKNSRLDIFNLNYDTWLEQILVSKYRDGYIAIDERYSKFYAKAIFEGSEDLHSINHLHGQVCFTSHHPNGRSRYVWEENCRLYKVNDFGIIQNQGVIPQYSGTMMATQSGEHIDSFPIITGLRKNEKIMAQPFDAYFHHFYQSIMQNNKLLIIGYGFGDLYINSILQQFSEFHNKEAKAVVITYVPENEWTIQLYDNPKIGHREKQFYYHLYREKDLSHRCFSYERPEYIEAQNQSKRIYMMGFKVVAEKYGKDIASFFEAHNK